MADYDLIIKFPLEDKWVYASRDFIASQSPVFCKLIFEDPLTPKAEIEVSDVKSIIVHHAFQCIQTDGKSLASGRLAILLRKFAKAYEIDKLYNLCEEFLIKRISIDNVEEIHDLACHYSDANIQFYCWLMFESSWREVFSKASFYQCSESTMKRFVSRPIYKDMDEFFLWNALYTWGLTKMLRENSTENPERHRRILEEFIPKIRFLTMKREELNVIFNSKILTMQECNAIRIAYESRNVGNLPPTICSSTVPRSSENTSQHIIYFRYYFFPKHTKLRFIRTNDTFCAEFIALNDCFLKGLVLPIITGDDKSRVQVFLTVLKSKPFKILSDKSVSWTFDICSPKIDIFPPVFIEAKCKVWIYACIQEDTSYWQIEPSTSCYTGQFKTDVCEIAELWQLFYVKNLLLYF